MKQLSQLLALYLPGANTLQVMLTIAILTLLIRQVASKIAENIKDCSVKKRVDDFKNDMWAIE
jgi:hypothetical protein